MALRGTPLTAVSAFTANVYPPQPNSTVESADVQAGEQALLNRTQYIYDSLLAVKRTVYTFSEDGAGPTYVIGPPNSFTTTTFTDSKVTLDVTGCVVGDDLEIRCFGDWQLNAASVATVVGRAKINIVEDASGAPLAVPNLYGKASIQTPGGGTVPHTSVYSLSYLHRITTAGTARITLQVCYEDWSGGAGTGTVILVGSARLDVVRYRRS